ncbi:MAG: DUF5667 domain-containing protein [Candidatus Nanohaloarchaeota archaeon QJJ-5]|nr:DUF5667 domain-containing protein [Candidatus Nanohaloarchaeota archaeon QJJ-5]
MGLASGQTNATAPDSDGPGPGLITPDSALYGLEVAFDNVRVSVGLSSAGGIAQERAAEAQAMMRQNKTQAMQRAADEMSNMAERATSADAEKLQKASDVLQRVMDQAPADAQEGLQQAMATVQNRTAAIGGPSENDGPGGNITPEPDDPPSDQNLTSNETGQQPDGESAPVQ